LEILQYEAIQKIQNELDDKRNNGKAKLKQDDLIEQDYTDFSPKIFQLKDKKGVNDFKNKVIENIINLRVPYSFLDNLIAKGNSALSGGNEKVIRDVLGALNTFYESTNDEGKRVYGQKQEVINNLNSKLMHAQQAAQQLHVNSK